ncbi:MAG: aminotransferase class I/II-fold pyridoxal phosphate-dependent enzyme, partial [Micrococcales bacterium]|nr:aminotransferase class I/II-fold pyridoxal phosphate-dependent enzyme [Micrococcales bacterium]
KAFAFAGARVGYLAADPAVIDALRLVRLPYHLSSLTQAAALAALAHAPVMLQMVDDIVAQRDRISATVEALGYRAYESWTNFVLFSGVEDSGRTWQQLYDRGILVRDVGIPRSLRVSAGTAEETTAFLEALASIDSRA